MLLCCSWIGAVLLAVTCLAGCNLLVSVGSVALVALGSALLYGWSVGGDGGCGRFDSIQRFLRQLFQGIGKWSLEEC